MGSCQSQKCLNAHFLDQVRIQFEPAWAGDVNEFYSSREASLLDQATTELQKAVAINPDNLAALQWMAAIEVLQWGGTLNLQQFRSVNSLLKKCANLDPKQPDRHYWIAATNWIFASRGQGASAAEHTAIVDEGIERPESV